EASGIRMPSFFGYMAWSAGILLPLFLIMTLIFF
ncbi:MAG: putative citrate transport, partial [Proteobacteria bacterium]|nr:putative citrate transport [Pseudomonadota bacterium]